MKLAKALVFVSVLVFPYSLLRWSPLRYVAPLLVWCIVVVVVVVIFDDEFV
jgi:hypothetical protein